MLNAIILSSRTSTDTFVAQPAFVLPMPSRDAEEPLVETEDKETVL